MIGYSKYAQVLLASALMKYWEIIAEQAQRQWLDVGLLQRYHAARLAVGP
jgi:hypothetical protein